MTSTGGCEAGGKLDKLGTKSKSTASLAMVKELVHRDNGRLVKDLMALLAIREATKEATVVVAPTGGTQPSNDDADAGRKKVVMMEEVLLKNRPGDTTAGIQHDGNSADETQNDGGTKAAAAAATAAAVASLLHRTATKEFSSLAGEIIAIADDEAEDDTPGAKGSNEVLYVCRKGEIDTAGNDDGVTTTRMMLHADATTATTDLNHTNEKPTDNTEKQVLPELLDGQDGEQDVDVFISVPVGDGSGPEEPASGGDNVPHRPDKVGCFLSGPVPVSLPAVGSPVPAPRTSTPIPGWCRPLNLHPEPMVPLIQQQQRSPATSLTLEQKLDKLLDSVVKIKADMHRRIDRLGKRVEQIHLDVQLNIDNTDRALLRNDLLLIGIPHLEREDLQQCFWAVCRVLEYSEQDIPQVDIRRQRVTGGGGGGGNRRTTAAQKQHGGGGGDTEPATCSPAPIVVEFMFKTLRDQFYRAYQAKRVLRLSDIGFSSDRRFFVNEVLTKYNQKLMAEAVRRKRLGQLHSVYTVDGIVYVQRVAGEKGTKVTSFSCLN
uniref:Uncharacterized protein n=1 Tax=Anopheles epiroticus TaxID=199890 RepID=A0A182P6D1_9DIPT